LERKERFYMRLKSRYLSGLILGAALLQTVPQMAIAGASASPVARHDDDHDKRVRRYYDRDRKEYHEWTKNEDRAYRHWLEERREAYRDFGKLNRARQRQYWTWRHEHPGTDWDRR
jgi:hypothetical protein